MKTSQSAAPSDHALLQVRNDLVSDSLYGRLSAHFCVHLSSLAETGLPQHVLTQPLFGAAWREDSVVRLGRFLECTPEAIRRMQAREFQSTRLDVVSRSLRYCPQCLQDGYHSALYQHLAVSRCERHNVLLRRACPKCRRQMLPTVATVYRYPYQCSSCEWAFSSLSTQKRRMDEGRAHDLELMHWKTVLAAAGAANSPSRKLDVDTAVATEQASQPEAKHLHRALFLEADGVRVPWRFREEALLVKASQLTQQDCICHTEALIKATNGLAPLLRWFSRHCAGADQACRLAMRLGAAPGGYRLNMHVGVLGVALCKTLYCYGLMRDFMDIHCAGHHELRLDSRCAAPIRRSSPIFECEEADQRLLQLEILSLMAKLLAGFRTGTPLWRVEWIVAPHAATYVPSWTLDSLPRGAARIRVRSRATEETLKKLFSRYVHNWYWLDRDVSDLRSANRESDSEAIP